MAKVAQLKKERVDDRPNYGIGWLAADPQVHVGADVISIDSILKGTEPSRASGEDAGALADAIRALVINIDELAVPYTGVLEFDPFEYRRPPRRRTEQLSAKLTWVERRRPKTIVDD